MDTFLTGRRAAQDGFLEPSFPTIAGSGPHGAIIHYRAEPETCGTVSASQLLLVDSGAHLPLPILLTLFLLWLVFYTLAEAVEILHCAITGGQYDCGTTDVTRTFHLGEPTKHQRMCFTRVLQVKEHMHTHARHCPKSPLLHHFLSCRASSQCLWHSQKGSPVSCKRILVTRVSCCEVLGAWPHGHMNPPVCTCARSWPHKPMPQQMQQRKIVITGRVRVDCGTAREQR